MLAVIGADAAFAGVVREAARFAPPFSARMALALSAPKLIAEMLKTDAEYGCVQSGPPIVMRNVSRRDAAAAPSSG